MAEDVTLRPYREGDLPALHALDQVCFPPGIAYSRAELHAFLAHPSSFTAVACAGGEIAGFAIVRSMRRRTSSALHLLTIDVAPPFRRRGVGLFLMGWVFSKGRELGSRSVELEVAVDNAGAQHFYARLGFDVQGTIPGYYNGVTDALRMERALGSATEL